MPETAPAPVKPPVPAPTTPDQPATVPYTEPKPRTCPTPGEGDFETCSMPARFRGGPVAG